MRLRTLRIWKRLKPLWLLLIGWAICSGVILFLLGYSLFDVRGGLPKVEAAMRFARTYPNRKAIITSLDKAIDALEGKTGTAITFA